MSVLPDLLVQIYSRHAVYLEGYKTHAAKDFEQFLRIMQSDIIGQLVEVEDIGQLKVRRLKSLLRAVRETLDAGFGDYEAVWRKQLEELAEYESGYTTRALGQVVKADFTLPSPAQILTAAFARPLDVSGADGGSLLEAFFKNWTDRTKRRVEGAIRMGAAQGQSLPEVVRRLKGTRARRYQDGLFQATRRDMMLMARTSLHHIASQSRSAVYSANKGIIAQEEFVAVLDGRTSALCRGLSGERYDVGEGPQPPLHLACRSVRVPRLRDGLDIFADAGTQFSRGAKGIKRVDADLDYYEWLKTQPKAFQESAIGVSRSRLLRNGGLSADRFQKLQLDKNFRERSLDELRELEPLAFERAGI